MIYYFIKYEGLLRKLRILIISCALFGFYDFIRDLIIDFRNMSFENETFKMVVFDPPHLNKLGHDTWMAKKYGVLLPTWELDIKAGFDECMRVLEPGGTLIFKWNEIQVTLNKLLEIIKVKPLFGHVTGKHGRTIWMSFMKGVSCNGA